MWRRIKKISERFLEASIRTKILILMVLVVIPLSVGTYLIFQRITQSSLEVQKAYFEETVSILKQSALDNAIFQAKIFDLTFKNITIDTNFLKNQIIENGFKENILKDYYYKQRIISYIIFIDKENRLFVFPQEEKIDISQIKEINFLSEKKFFIGTWIGPFFDPITNKKIISYVLPIWQKENYQGAIIIKIPINIFFTEIVNINPSQTSYAFLLRKTGEIIYSSERIFDDFLLEKKDFPNIFESQLVEKENLSLYFSPLQTKTGFFELYNQQKEIEKIVSFALIPSFEGKLFIVSPLKEITQIQLEKNKEFLKTIQHTASLSYIFITLVILFSIVVSFLFLYFFFIRPIFVIQNGIKNIEKGVFDIPIKTKAGKELDDLAMALNIMSVRLGSAKKDLEKYATELERMVSERTLELEEERYKLEKILTSMGEGVIVVDSDNNIILTNPVAEIILKKKNQELLGKKIFENIQFFTGKKGKDKIDFKDFPIKKAIEQNKLIYGGIEENFYIENSAKNKIPIAFAITPIISKKFSGAVMVFRDITEEKRLDEAKTDFISVSSHQLRTPLTSMRWFSEMLLAGDAGPLNREQKHFIERIYEGIERMIGLVNLLLQIARVEAGRVKVEPIPINLKNLTEEVIMSLKANFEGKKQKIIIKSIPEELPLINIDKEIVWQVIQNLLSNANRYSPPETTIFVSIIQKGDFLEYSVKDEGIGIPKEQQGRIFEKFFRADNALKEVPTGSGLGLSLAKLLVDGWGGKIWFESEERKGTTFYFTIPLKGMKAKEGEVKINV